MLSNFCVICDFFLHPVRCPVLRPKNICDQSLNPKNIEHVNFQPQKIVRTPTPSLIMYTPSTPWVPTPSIFSFYNTCFCNYMYMYVQPVLTTIYLCTYAVKRRQPDLSICNNFLYTRFFYKNKLYKNTQAEISPKVKKKLRTTTRLKF